MKFIKNITYDDIEPYLFLLAFLAIVVSWGNTMNEMTIKVIGAVIYLVFAFYRWVED